MECEPTVCHELKEELSRVHKDLKLALEEKNMNKAEQEQERITSQEVMDELQHDLKQAFAERDESAKQVDEDIESMRNDVQLFKVIKYK